MEVAVERTLRKVLKQQQIVCSQCGLAKRAGGFSKRQAQALQQLQLATLQSQDGSAFTVESLQAPSSEADRPKTAIADAILAATEECRGRIPPLVCKVTTGSRLCCAKIS